MGIKMKYKVVDEHTEEIIKASSFLAKIKGKDQNIINMLTNRYREDIANFDNTVVMCFYQWFLADDKLDLADTNSVFQITFDVVNKIEDTLEQKPEYWILWILKYKIISFMNFNENELICALNELIKNQEQQDEQMSYFLVSDVLLAHVCYSKGFKEKAKSILENVLIKYTKKVTILNNFFRGFVMEFRNLLLRSDEDDLLALTYEILEKYF